MDIVSLLLMHWFADFVLQTRYQAINKSRSIKALLTHTSIYSLFWFILWPILGINTLYFVGITFICHTITDYFTSRINAKLYNENKIYEFFVSIGFDQWLHHAQLIITYNYL